MQLDIATATILSAAVATVVGGGITAVNLWLARRSDERRQIRELAVQAAIQNWSRDFEITKIKEGRTILQPLDLYLVHAMHLVSALDGSLKTPEAIRKHLRETFTLTSAAEQEITEYNNARENDAAPNKIGRQAASSA